MRLRGWRRELTRRNAVKEREHPDGSALVSGDGGVDSVGLLEEQEEQRHFVLLSFRNAVRGVNGCVCCLTNSMPVLLMKKS